MALTPEQEADADRAAQHFAKFVTELCEEGERAAVVLGAARVELFLEDLLKAVLRPTPGGSDDLFEGDRPLSNFSAKIAIAYRLNLIENDTERALQLLRRIRNEFAHAHERLTLDQGAAANRLLELKRLCHNASFFCTVGESLEKSPTHPQLRLFAQCIATIMLKLETTRVFCRRYDPGIDGSLASLPKKRESQNSFPRLVKAILASPVRCFASG